MELLFQAAVSVFFISDSPRFPFFFDREHEQIPSFALFAHI